jgi:surface antigen
MKKISLALTPICFIALGIVACSTDMFSSSSSDTMSAPAKKMALNEPATAKPLAANEQNADGGTIGGRLAASMDVNDKSKLSHALDNGLGKSTEWTNALTNITYTVTPTEKVTLAGHAVCRKYTLQADKGGQEQNSTRTACLDANSNWQEV